MDQTKITHKIRAFYALHGHAINVLSVSIAFCLPLISSDIATQRAYIIEEEDMHRPLHEDRVNEVMEMLKRRQERMQERMETAALSSAAPSLTIALQETETLHPSAQPEVILDIRSSSSAAESASSSAASVYLAEPVSSSAASIDQPTISSSSRSSSASVTPVAPVSDFPAMGNAVFPVTKVPNWGAMTKPSEWNRTYAQMSDEDFVSIPRYDLSKLTIPLETLAQTRHDPETIKILTAKLLYSTRHFGSYNLDSGEFESAHSGIDLKLPEGMAIGTVAGGKVREIGRDDGGLGLYIVIEHRAADGNTFYSVYGHLASVSVKAGDNVTSGQAIGTVGISGNTTGAHLHLQIDRGSPDEASHTLYVPASAPSPGEADLHSINPITFIANY